MGQHKMRAEDAKEVMRVAYAEGLKDGAAKARAEERADKAEAEVVRLLAETGARGVEIERLQGALRNVEGLARRETLEAVNAEWCRFHRGYVSGFSDWIRAQLAETKTQATDGIGLDTSAATVIGPMVAKKPEEPKVERWRYGWATTTTSDVRQWMYHCCYNSWYVDTEIASNACPKCKTVWRRPEAT